MGIEREFYKKALTHACTKTLFEINAVLSGKAEGARYQLALDQYEQAREHLVCLCMIVTRPRLERTLLSQARDDAAFQRFLAGVTRSTTTPAARPC
jgi:hypothetical protein